jgi:hypothetical protein
VEPPEIAALVDRLLASPMSDEAARRVSALGRRLITAGVDYSGAQDLINGSPWAAMGAWGDLPLGEQLDAAQCILLLDLGPDRSTQYAAIWGSLWERGRLLDGLARRCGVQVAAEALARAGRWRMLYRLDARFPRRAVRPQHLGPVPGVHGRADVARLRQLIGTTAVFQPGYQVRWCADLAEMVQAEERVRRGAWVEISWPHPTIALTSTGVILREVTLDGPVTLRLQVNRLAAVEVADRTERRAARGYRVRVVPVISRGDGHRLGF